jgi:uncharacterized protein YegL
MIGEKIKQLNFAIREAIDPMRDTASENPNAQVLVRVLTFSTGARWHLATPTPIEDFKWSDISAHGVTDMGKALTMVADQLKVPPMADHALRPVLMLISDGQPTDDFSSGLKKLMKEQWGQKAVRLAVAVGKDADRNVLTKFIGSPEFKPLQANNAAALVDYIRWASTAVLKAVTSPLSQQAGGSGANNVPKPPPPPAAVSDVW